jgi:hypothetical protein
MTTVLDILRGCSERGASLGLVVAYVLPLWIPAMTTTAAEPPNLLKNPGFEESSVAGGPPAEWVTRKDSSGKALISEKEFHNGHFAIALLPQTALEQTILSAAPGAYTIRGWVKSESAQSLTILLQDTVQPWVGYTCAEIPVPAGRWIQIEAFCVLERPGSLTLTVGGVSKDFRFYHGAGAEMNAPIFADDFELFRNEIAPPAEGGSLALWDAGPETGADLDWSARSKWTPVKESSDSVSGSPVIQGRDMVGSLRKIDGALVLYSVREGRLQRRGVLVPSSPVQVSQCRPVFEKDRVGLRVISQGGARSYTAWFSARGLIEVNSSGISSFEVRECKLSYGLLPSFVGTDICYSPQALTGRDRLNIPSTQWFVGLGERQDSLMVGVWESGSQKVAIGLSGAGAQRVIDSVSVGTETNRFWFTWVNHPGIWHRENLEEDWLGEYHPIAWRPPFPARWMEYFRVTTGGKASFRDPGVGYGFPVADAKTRMWGVWFEDWNHYPFFFDGARTVLHFEKTFVPQGEALFYFLEPARADIYSPCEVVEQALGPEKAAALLDFEANRLRKLNYSTPDEFLLDRPVCATTTRLSKIKQEEKATLGVDLATHLYEFIREIRARVDQYEAFFAEMQEYLETRRKEGPAMQEYVAELERMIAEARTHSKQIYTTPLSAVQTKTEDMKKLLREGKGDGFNCGDLDVRSPAGAQDDLCRRYNRFVLGMVQTAALKCGDAPEKAVVARQVWERSRALLRRPTRWEPRRTIYFFEP